MRPRPEPESPRRVSETLPDAALLARELSNFQARVTVATLEVNLTWREGKDDDLVLAVAVAAWEGERHRCDRGFASSVSSSRAWWQ